MRVSLTPEENARVKVVFVRDYPYKNHLWLANVSRQVNEIIGDSESVVLVGHEHDYTSGYLRSFPQWKKHLLPNIDTLPHATTIRYLYFTHDVNYKNALHADTASYLDNFKKTNKFKATKAYFDAMRISKNAWSGAPYAPIFHTTDCVVIKSGHVLCVRRGKAYGGGQIALPGGFLDKSIKDHHTFDHPDRSERGRTITEAFFIDLGDSGPLPKVKGGDDAAKAWWEPLESYYTREEEFFEDHYHVVDWFVGSPFTK
jgi:bifunctional NMN adenylyltransferase/nudix hydrolase